MTDNCWHVTCPGTLHCCHSTMQSPVIPRSPGLFLFVAFIFDADEEEGPISSDNGRVPSSLKMEEEEIDFKVEAELVIEDIGFTVESINISKKLPCSRECVYLNVLTKERKSLCVELSVLGFRIIGDKFDENQEGTESKYYETMYALLDSVSPGYTQSFGEALVQKLASLPVHDGEDTSEMPDEAADKKLSS